MKLPVTEVVPSTTRKIEDGENQIPTQGTAKISSHLENMRIIKNGQITKETEMTDTDVVVVEATLEEISTRVETVRTTCSVSTDLNKKGSVENESVTKLDAMHSPRFLRKSHTKTLVVIIKIVLIMTIDLDNTTMKRLNKNLRTRSPLKKKKLTPLMNAIKI